MNPGSLRHRIELLRTGKTRNAWGELEDTETVVATVSASITGMSGKELTDQDAGQTVTQMTHRIYMRYHPGVTPEMKIRFEGRVFEILYVSNYKELDKTLYIMAKELYDYGREI